MWCPMSQIMSNLVLKFHVVVAMAPGGRLAQISLTQLNEYHVNAWCGAWIEEVSYLQAEL